MVEGTMDEFVRFEEKLDEMMAAGSDREALKIATTAVGQILLDILAEVRNRKG